MWVGSFGFGGFGVGGWGLGVGVESWGLGLGGLNLGLGLGGFDLREIWGGCGVGAMGWRLWVIQGWKVCENSRDFSAGSGSNTPKPEFCRPLGVYFRTTWS